MRNCLTSSVTGLFLTLSLCVSAWPSAPEDVRILLTSNLEGRFDVEKKEANQDDPFLIRARGMLADRVGQGPVFYFDLGNAFFPGALAQYSFGSIVMDFFDALSCDGMLVSSKDLQITVAGLESLEESGKTRFVSANLERDGAPLFTPQVVCKTGKLTLDVIGVSSGNVLFDVAEKNLQNLEIDTDLSNMDAYLKTAKEGKGHHVILLSGLKLDETMEVLTRFPKVGLAICGGDNVGDLYGKTALRVQLADGRWVVQLPLTDGYYVLDLLVGDTIEIRSLTEKTKERLGSEGTFLDRMKANPGYRELVRRIALWKERFWEDEADVVADTHGRELRVDDGKLSLLLRDRFNAEIALVKEQTITPTVFLGKIRAAQVMELVGRDYNLFVYNLKGNELRRVTKKLGSLVVSGFENKDVQGYPLDQNRPYRVVSAQPTLEAVERLLDKHIVSENTWVTVTDLLTEDFKFRKVVFREKFEYLDRRFRSTLDFSLDNYFTDAIVSGAKSLEPPPGRPTESYRQWGLENQIDFTVYNRRHEFKLTSYMNYEREKAVFMENLLRGTFVYNLNIDKVVKPYHKSQVETVVEAIGGRPVVVRETFGAYFEKTFHEDEVYGEMGGRQGALSPLRRYSLGEIQLNGNLGLGFEKKVQDPSTDPFFGIEIIGTLEVPIWKDLKYIFDLDAFVSFQSLDPSREYIRSQVENALSLSVNRWLDVSFKHRWYYFRSSEYPADYNSSEVFTALGCKFDTKFW